MRLADEKLLLSPSDLSNHLVCAHLTTLNLAVARGEMQAPKTDDHFVEVLRARGDEHEKAYVASLLERGLNVTDLSGHKFSDDAFEATRSAIGSGAPVIVQAALAGEGWAGYADILIRVATSSALGDWSYEVVDTKLAQETRGGTILQLCAYSEMVGEIQGRTPERFHVVTPGDPFVEQTYRFDEYAAYYRFVRARLEAAVGAVEADQTYPEPVEHCDICRWQRVCSKRLRADDHLSLVAGIRRSQRDELTRHAVRTLAARRNYRCPSPSSRSAARARQ